MKAKTANMSPRDLIYTALAVAIGVVFLIVWYLAPEILTVPLWTGSPISFGFVAGTISLFGPILISWLLIRHDDTNE